MYGDRVWSQNDIFGDYSADKLLQDTEKYKDLIEYNVSQNVIPQSNT